MEAPLQSSRCTKIAYQGPGIRDRAREQIHLSSADRMLTELRIRRENFAIIDWIEHVIWNGLEAN